MDAASPDSAVETYLRAIAGTLKVLLGDSLVGVYLHGSAAMGGFVPGRSDVDVLAVSSRPLTTEERERVGRALVELPAPHTGSTLEFSLMTAAAARDLVLAPPFELHVGTAQRPAITNGAGHPGDPDLLGHVAVVLARGRVVFGAPAENVFGKVPRAWLVRFFFEEMDWAERNASPEYGVLNACRTWRFLEEGAIGSKVEGAVWAMKKVDDPSIVEEALSRQRGDETASLDRVNVRAFVQPIRAMLERDIGDT